MQVADMAKMSGIAPDKVFKDIAENAEAASTFFHGDLNALTKNAIQAQRMGTSLKQQVSLAEKLLDFEAGIEDELVAATFVGGEFNLSRARALAMEGKLADANKETLSQLQRSGDFRKKDYFTQQQLAKAAGMSVEEINKQLNAQEKLNSLSAEEQKMAQEAIDKGLDITNINKEQLGDEVKKFAAQQEQQGQLTRLQNAFMGIAASIGGTLSPLLEGLVPILEMVLAPVQLIATAFSSIKDIIKGIFDPTTSLKDLFAEMGPLTTGIAVALGIAGAAVLGSMVPGLIRAGIAAAAQLPVLYSMAVAAITSASAATLGIGLISIIGGIAAGVYAMKSASKAGDVLSPADGKTQVSTKEGGLFELSPNDDLVAAPGAAKAVVGGNGAPQMNLAVLSAPLNAMIAEIKGLRADMAAGKISVHMDGAKVTAGVSTQVNKSTRNNFAIA
jgi:transcriptional regulator with XRE-family HTH domain